MSKLFRILIVGVALLGMATASVACNGDNGGGDTGADSGATE
jgi:hypothetical protein